MFDGLLFLTQHKLKHPQPKPQNMSSTISTNTNFDPFISGPNQAKKKITIIIFQHFFLSLSVITAHTKKKKKHVASLCTC